MRISFNVFLVVALLLSAGCNRNAQQKVTGEAEAGVLKIEEGYVDANGIMIYYKTFGNGQPLLILHGGPGASHDYFLPYLLPLAKDNKLVFIDERGSGQSGKIEDPSEYTIENMVEDVEAVRKQLRLGKISLMGHSFGGMLAQAYALKYQDNLDHLLLCSTTHSVKMLNDFFRVIRERMDPELKSRIDKMENAGLFGKGKDFEKNRYTAEYMTAAWGEGYFPYLYQNHPDPNYDPLANGIMSWDLYRQMWGSHGEFVVDGNLVSVEYADRLQSIKVPTLITVGDHDEIDPSISEDMHRRIPGSEILVLPKSGHMTFVDQPSMFISAVEEFLHGQK